MGQFVNSVIRQLGRDTGKVLSNSVYGDAHSTPIRMTGKSGSAQSQGRTQARQKSKSEFEKALNFDRSATPKTLVRKIQALSVLLEEETSVYLNDDYLSADEAREAFEKLNKFSQKAESVAKQLELDEEGNSKEIKQLEKIVIQANEDFHLLLGKGAESCDEMVLHLEALAKEKGSFNPLVWVLLNTVFMRGYAKTGQKKLTNTILANILLIGVGHAVMLVVGVVSMPSEYLRKRKEEKLYLKAAEKEKERSNSYKELISK